MTQHLTFIERAVPYAKAGYKVFPLVPFSKRPITPNGVKDATARIDIIERWATEYPVECNVGVAGGWGSGPNGLLILDVDKQHDGHLTLQKLLTEPGREMPPSPIVTTPSGGFHVYFAFQEFNNRVGVLPGLDVRSTGGYVVGALSWWEGTKDGKIVLPGGGAYEWAKNPLLPPSMAPQWLIEALTPPPPKYVPQPIHVDPSNYDTQIRRAMALCRHVEAKPKGERNHALYWAVNRALDNGLHDAQVILTMFVQAGVNAGMDWKRCEKTVRSALTGRGIAT